MSTVTLFDHDATNDSSQRETGLFTWISITNVVLSLQERVKAWQNWQAITSSLTKKREAKVKAELGQRMDKVSILRQEIAELERQQDMAQENFDRISRQIKKEVEQFDERKAFDFKKSIVKYLEDMQKSQEKIAAQWERYLPEVQQLSI